MSSYVAYTYHIGFSTLLLLSHTFCLHPPLILPQFPSSLVGSPSVSSLARVLPSGLWSAVSQSVGRLVGGLVGWLVGHWSVSWWVDDWLVSWLVGWVVF